MASGLHLEPELAAVVQQARQRAKEAGELARGPFPPFESTIPTEAGQVIGHWLRDGGYDIAIALIGADDPDLANL
ncbi:MAG: hypothetical protein ACRDWV_06490 [Acidimicrobiales bacterium]